MLSTSPLQNDLLTSDVKQSNTYTHHAIEPSIGASLVHDVAISTFKEMMISATMTAITCYFVASTAIPLLLTTAINMVAINCLIRGLTAYQQYKLYQLEQQNDPNNNAEIAFLKKNIRLGQWICPMHFACLDQTTSAILLHEVGHAMVARGIYQNANPRIEIFPLNGGITRYQAGPLTKLGKFVGEENSDLLVTAAGPAFGIIGATIQIALSHLTKKDYPEASKYLLVAGISSIAQHIIYALSALWARRKDPGHDFLQLWKVGNIHPIVSIISMVALPILVKGILVATDCC